MPTCPCGSPGPTTRAAIAGVQVRAWPELYAGLLPAEVTAGPTSRTPSPRRGAESLRASGDARNRVLVALERNRVVGFALTSAGRRPRLRPRRRRRAGRGDPRPRGARRRATARGCSRRPSTPCAADRFTRAVSWVNAGDDALRTFLTDAGWAPDTAHRELDLDGTGATTVKQVRLHTAIA